jgi:hypothetical protein
VRRSGIATLETLTPGAVVRGLLPDVVVTVVAAAWFGSDAIELTYRTAAGKVEGFAYADSYDEAAGRYRGLRTGQLVNVSENDLSGLLVRPEAALAQVDREKPQESPIPLSVDPAAGTSPAPPVQATEPIGPRAPTRYHGTVRIDPTRAGRDAGKNADEVLAHLVGLVGTNVTVTLEIEATIPSGAPENVVRTVTQNGRDLKFTSGGFESE